MSGIVYKISGEMVSLNSLYPLDSDILDSDSNASLDFEILESKLTDSQNKFIQNKIILGEKNIIWRSNKSPREIREILERIKLKILKSGLAESFGGNLCAGDSNLGDFYARNLGVKNPNIYKASNFDFTNSNIVGYSTDSKTDSSMGGFLLRQKDSKKNRQYKPFEKRILKNLKHRDFRFLTKAFLLKNITNFRTIRMQKLCNLHSIKTRDFNMTKNFKEDSKDPNVIKDLTNLQNSIKNTMRDSINFQNLNDRNFINTYVFKCENKDWISEYKKSVRPVSCGGFYIRASWHRNRKNYKNIVIDPSLSFGSGHHASTKICIMFLSTLTSKKDSKHAKDSTGNMKSKDPKPLKNMESKTMLDIGCGSGILSLLGATLGFKIYACDVDKEAIIQTQNNFRINNLEYDSLWQGSINQNTINIRAGQGSNNLESLKSLETLEFKENLKSKKILYSTNKLESKMQDFQNLESIYSNSIRNPTKDYAKQDSIKTCEKYNIIVANLITSIILMLKNDLIRSLSKDGILILSGILKTQENEILNNFSALKLLEKKEIDEWIGFKFIKN